jgi:nicotinamidase-related amidase
MGGVGCWPGNLWRIDGAGEDMATRPAPRTRSTWPRASTPRHVTSDLGRTAIGVVDMPNDFCANGGGCDQSGQDLARLRSLITLLQASLPVLRPGGVPVLYADWVLPPDLLDIPPPQFFASMPPVNKPGDGFGAPLPGDARRRLVDDSWDAAIVAELSPTPNDLVVKKHRISVFFETSLDTVLRNMEIDTLPFAGVNLDQCVLCTLQEANFRGHGSLQLQEYWATLSPYSCVATMLFNVGRHFCFGATSPDLAAAIADAGPG